MGVKGEVLVQLLNKNKLRKGAKTFLEPNIFLFIVKIKKLRFSVPLRLINRSAQFYEKNF